MIKISCIYFTIGFFINFLGAMEFIEKYEENSLIKSWLSNKEHIFYDLNSIQIRNIFTGKIEKTIKCLKKVCVKNFTLFGKKKYLINYNYQGVPYLRLYNSSDHFDEIRFIRKSFEIYASALHKNKQLYAIGGQSSYDKENTGIIEIYNILKKEDSYTINAFETSVQALEYDTEIPHHLIAAGLEKGKAALRLFDINTQQKIQDYRECGKSIIRLMNTPSTLYTADIDDSLGTVSAWDKRTSKKIAVMGDKTCSFHYPVQINPYKFLAECKNNLVIWDTRTADYLIQYYAPGEIYNCLITPNKRNLISCEFNVEQHTISTLYWKIHSYL